MLDSQRATHDIHSPIEELLEHLLLGDSVREAQFPAKVDPDEIAPVPGVSLAANVNFTVTVTVTVTATVVTVTVTVVTVTVTVVTVTVTVTGTTPRLEARVSVFEARSDPPDSRIRVRHSDAPFLKPPSHKSLRGG
jgi:hypothetical protein